MKPLLILGAASIVLVSLLCTVVNYYHGKSERLGSTVKQQVKTLAQQSGLISTLQEQDRKNRALAAEQQQREQQLRQQGERYQRALREALKNDKCGNSPMPAAVIDLLHPDTKPGAETRGAITP